MPGIYPLKGVVKHYDWGGDSFIPSLLQINNIDKKPFAEYWLGIHPLGTAYIEKEGKRKLISEMVASIPYLFKVLDVHKMLSIQVHPTKREAEKGFEIENKEGVPIDSPRRNYKDSNHKPELMVALSDFWLLHGFKPKQDLDKILEEVPEFNSLQAVFNSSGYQGLYKFIMEMDQSMVNSLLRSLLTRITPFYSEADGKKSKEEYWAVKAASTFSSDNNIDRGIFSIFFFNLVFLKKGEGIFQDAGVPHAYLEGQNVEIMANSDNVLRGGLTSKHIDVNELLKHVTCEPIIPQIISGKELISNETVYETTVNDFQLSLFLLQDHIVSEFISTKYPEILLLTEGVAEVSSGEKSHSLKPGHPAVLILPGSKVQIKAESKSLIFRASVPIHKG